MDSLVDSEPSDADGARQASVPDAVALRGAAFTLPVLRLGSADLAAVERALAVKLAQAATLMHDAPVVIDLQAVQEGAGLDLAGLVWVLRSQGLVPIAVRHAAAGLATAARAAGLAVLSGGRDAQPAPAPTAAPAAPTSRLVTQPVRSGQRVVAAHGDLVVVAPVNTGAELLAAGNVHVYGPLRGRAMAGVNGDPGARILTTCLHAELVAVAGFYRTLEDDLPPELRGQPAQIFLDGDRLCIEPLASASAPSADGARKGGSA